MSEHIPERDWKKFKKLHPILLERFSHKTLQMVRTTVDGPGSSQERYLSLYKLIMKRDKQLANAFNDYRRSTAIHQLGIMRGYGLVRDEELSEFSELTRTMVENVASLFTLG